MCARYLPPKAQKLADHFRLDPREYEFEPETFPGYTAPMIRPLKGNRSSDQNEIVSAVFGMVPHWADLSIVGSTYNARTETVAGMKSYRNAWKRQQFCVIPAEVVFEFKYHLIDQAPVIDLFGPVAPDPKKQKYRKEKWGIKHVSGEPLGVAGIWEVKPGQDAAPDLLSFSMLTVNAAAHPIMNQFHAPEDEKRSVVILKPNQYEAWLHADPENVSDFLHLFPAEELVAAPA